MMRRTLGSVVLLLLVSAAAARAQTVRFLTASGARDSTNIHEPFAVQVDVPAGAPTPATINVTLSNGHGQDQAVTVTRVPGTSSYVSQTITVSAGAQKSGLGAYLPGGLSRSVDPVKVANGESMTASIQGGASASMPVYENATKQAIARNLESMNRRSDELARLSKTAQDGVARIDDTLKTTTDAGARDALEKSRTELVKQRDIARAESATLGEGRRLMQEPSSNDLEVYRYTDQYKLSMSNEFLKLSKDPTASPRDWQDAWSRADRIAKSQWDDAFQQFELDYARGWYEATTSFTMAGPALTLFGGKTIYWKDATLGERLSAFKELALAFAMMKAIPAATDIIGERITGELGGYGTNSGVEITITNGGGTSKAGPPPEAGPRGPDAVVTGAKEASAMDSLNRVAEAAKGFGVSKTVVDGIVDEGFKEAAERDGGEASIEALGEAELDLARQIFKRVFPDASVITDFDLLERVRAVRIKASLEASASPQRWTSDEVVLLHEMLNDPAWRNAWEFEDPFEMTGFDEKTPAGYTQILSEDDLHNLKLATSKPLIVENVPPDPVIAEQLKAFRAEQRAPQPLGRTATAKPAAEPPQPKPRPRTLGDQLEVGKLRDAIIKKRIQSGRRAATYRKSPLANREAVSLRPENLTPEDVAQFTADELHRITPDEIRQMTTETREALPVERLNTRQLEAVARGDGLPAPAPTGGDAVSTYGAEAGAAINAGRYDDAQKALDELGRTLVEPDAPKKVATGPSVPASGSIVITDDAHVAMSAFRSGDPWKGAIDTNGTITVTSPDGSTTKTLAPAPLSGFTPLPGGGAIATFPALSPPNAGSADGTPAPSGPPIVTPGPIEDGFFIPGRTVGLAERISFPPNPAGPEPVDLSDGLAGPFTDGPRDPGVQMFMGLLDSPVVVPGAATATPMARGGSVRERGHLLARLRPGHSAGSRARASAGSNGRALWLNPIESRQRAPRGGVKAVFVSLGVATGEAFQIQVINDGPAPVNLMADGVVLEPVPRKEEDQLRRQMETAITGRGSNAPAPTVARMSGYCMEYLKLPPTPGSLFRVASAEIQAKFSPMRRVLQAEERLQRLGLLKPDSNPLDYIHSIRQWALWTKEQGFDAQSFATAFVDHAKKNFAAAKQPWTRQIEAQISGLVPHRWQEISRILQEADKEIR